MNKLACALAGVAGERIALCDVAVSAVLQDLLSEVTVTQTYRNDEKVNIEAVYTFPLPLDAVLLELEVEIGGRLLKGVVVEKKAAEEQYEDAVESGDAAVMLELIEPGLYTLNVGNLLPAETAKITFSYAMLYRWSGDRLRFFLPTTIAPRFGDSPHAPHRAPESSLTVENEFSLRVEVLGSLRDAQFVCPSHAVTLARDGDKAVISFAQAKVVMDRDFVLNVKAPQATRSFALFGADGEGTAAVASFQPFFPGLRQSRPLNLAVVIDCSGSMAGDSMEQAKRAIEGILDALQANDCVTLVAFGNITKVFSQALLPCNKANLVKAKRFAKALEANMGGTEIGGALQCAYATVAGIDAADIFLVTDGEVSDWLPVVDEASQSGHRIFTVGVGSAVSEAFVRGLAAGTGGECELVSPQEGMADQVVRHFERMRAPRAKRVSVHWPEGATDFIPAKMGAVFEGDTMIASARFANASITGVVTLEVERDKGEVIRHELPISKALPDKTHGTSSTVSRLAASFRLKALGAKAGLEVALQYRLVSPWTNWLVIAERAGEEKSQGIPALRKVPQTLAAGWGGTGRVMFSKGAPSLTRDTSAMPVAFCMKESSLAQDIGIPQIDIASFLRKPVAKEPLPLLVALIEADPSRMAPGHVLGLLREAGLEAEFKDLFHRAHDLGLDVDVVAAIVLAGILGGVLGEYLSSGAQSRVASLQNYAQRATDALKEMSHHGSPLFRLLHEGISREIFRDGKAHALEEVLERIAGFREFLDRMHDCVKESEEKQKKLRARRLRMDRATIA
ncbi:MAG: VIT and VWA domain-containing protein [Betaproteobacteria bacterium]